MIDDVAVLRRCAVERSQDVFAELVRRNLAGVYPAVLRRVGEDFSDTTLMAEQAETLKMVFSGNQTQESTRQAPVFDWDTVEDKADTILSAVLAGALTGVRAHTELRLALERVRSAWGVVTASGGNPSR